MEQKEALMSLVRDMSRAARRKYIDAENYPKDSLRRRSLELCAMEVSAFALRILPIVEGLGPDPLGRPSALTRIRRRMCSGLTFWFLPKAWRHVLRK